MDIYELEVKNLLEEGGNERLKSQFMNLSRRLDDISNENKELKKQISELESELSVKENLLKIAMKFNRTPEENMRLADLFEDCEEEPLPFSYEEYAECLESKLEELRDRHQQDCITINQLHTTIDTLVDRYAKLREMKGVVGYEHMSR